MKDKINEKNNEYYQANTINEEKEDKYNIGDLDICNACSTMDCTGLMYRPPLNDDETDSYHEIYTFGPPEVKQKEL